MISAKGKEQSCFHLEASAMTVPNSKETMNDASGKLKNSIRQRGRVGGIGAAVAERCQEWLHVW